jgi:hypothetical protein
MPLEATTVGPIGHDTRDAVAQYRDENNLPNYDAALRTLLEEAGATDTLSAEG